MTDQPTTAQFKSTRNIFAIIILTVGILFCLFGWTMYGTATKQVSPSQQGMRILTRENNTIIDHMNIVMREEEESWNSLTRHEKGWRRVMIEFYSSCKSINLQFLLPWRIEHVWNLSKVKSFRVDTYSYDSSSRISLSYSSSEEKNWVLVEFDCRIDQWTSHDQWALELAFEHSSLETLSFDKSAYFGYGLWIPKIRIVTVQIEETTPLDLSCTIPLPTSYHFRDNRTISCWAFDSEYQPVSSIRAVFKEPKLSKQKSDLTFFSGAFISLGFSIIIWGLSEVMRVRAS